MKLRIIRNWRVDMPECPVCHSQRTWLDLLSIGNLVRVPFGLSAAWLIDDTPVRFGFRCRDCKARFLEMPDKYHRTKGCTLSTEGAPSVEK